jgi:hypothetical protein
VSGINITYFCVDYGTLEEGEEVALDTLAGDWLADGEVVC